MTDTTFLVSGSVQDRASGRAGCGLRVEAWDRDTRHHDLLGVATTDNQGRFGIAFDESHFGDDDPNHLPDLFFRVFRGQDVVAETAAAVRRDAAAGENRVLLEADLPAIADDSGALPAQSSEVVLHELGESIAAAVGSVQAELARYPNVAGSFILDEMELNIPVRMRVDPLGQVRATVVNGAPSAGTGQLRLRLKPVLGQAVPPPVSAPQPLEALATLSGEEIALLKTQRIYSVDDLLRVGRNASGRDAIDQLGITASLDEVRERAVILALPVLPSLVAEGLLRINVTTPISFVGKDPAILAEGLSNELGRPVSIEEVVAWQQGTRQELRLPSASVEEWQDR